MGACLSAIYGWISIAKLRRTRQRGLVDDNIDAPFHDLDASEGGHGTTLVNNTHNIPMPTQLFPIRSHPPEATEPLSLASSQSRTEEIPRSYTPLPELEPFPPLGIPKAPGQADAEKARLPSSSEEPRLPSQRVSGSGTSSDLSSVPFSSPTRGSGGTSTSAVVVTKSNEEQRGRPVPPTRFDNPNWKFPASVFRSTSSTDESSESSTDPVTQTRLRRTSVEVPDLLPSPPGTSSDDAEDHLPPANPSSNAQGINGGGHASSTGSTLEDLTNRLANGASGADEPPKTPEMRNDSGPEIPSLVRDPETNYLVISKAFVEGLRDECIEILPDLAIDVNSMLQRMEDSGRLRGANGDDGKDELVMDPNIQSQVSIGLRRLQAFWEESYLRLKGRFDEVTMWQMGLWEM